MKPFRIFLKEAQERLQREVHFNPSPNRLHALASNSENKSVRFVIDNNDNLWAGDSHYFVHVGLGDGKPHENVQTQKIIGYIDNHEGKSIVSAFYKGTNLSKKAKHPKIDFLLKNRNFVSGQDD